MLSDALSHNPYLDPFVVLVESVELLPESELIFPNLRLSRIPIAI